MLQPAGKFRLNFAMVIYMREQDFSKGTVLSLDT